QHACLLLFIEISKNKIVGYRGFDSTKLFWCFWEDREWLIISAVYNDGLCRDRSPTCKYCRSWRMKVITRVWRDGCALEREGTWIRSSERRRRWQIVTVKFESWWCMIVS